ncbi:hypothetical protein [Phaffia rhodozyma]|uniref:Uncharacterized protein n=1 Tax=Phaffia rhodozyma TaxID=264483 RepID=A0A0F7SS16_PHARH|nr:hypothetical protein [Phaffia rhodozyma]
MSAVYIAMDDSQEGLGLSCGLMSADDRTLMEVFCLEDEPRDRAYHDRHR